MDGLRRMMVVVACLGVVGCSSEEHSDLRQFVKEAEKLPHGRVPPLPEVKPYETFDYAATDQRSPFEAGFGGMES